MWFWRKKGKTAKQPLGNQCSFCSEEESEAARLFSGFEKAYICKECLEIAGDLFRDRKENPFSSPLLGLHCSFCLKSDEEIEHLVAGPAVYICDACVEHFQQSID